MKLPLREAAAALGVPLRSGEGLPERAAVVTDTRVLAPGDLFVALRGERFDGHAFVREALERGACAVVVADAACAPDDAPAFVVGDTLAAYQALGALARKRLDARIVAITGSAGKTTTKELTAQLLAAAGLGPAAATPANENNEIGVPKLFLALSGDERSVVVEMGCRHYGDIEPLVALAQPDVALLTNVGEAHLEIMGSRERLAETKFGIFASGALPLLNLDDAVSCERAGRLGREPVWFGARPSDAESIAHVSATARAIVLFGRDEMLLHELDRTRRLPIACRLPGDHNLVNLAGALAAAWVLGADAEALAAAIPSLYLPAGRYERRRVGAFDVIYDAYNASPAGMLATLASFAAEPAARKIVVLGSMAEVGPEAPQMHRRAGAAAAAVADAFLVGGDFADDLAAGARGAGFPADRIAPFADNASALAWLSANVRAGDLVLLKASRRYKLEEILAGLEAEHV